MAQPFRATYRLQLGPGLGFREARELVPYLRDLGVSHLYLSPVLQARKGSTHGYDVVDPTRISEELGGEQAFRELAAAELGIVLDVVPNHMAATDENPYWRDPELRAKFFDVDTRTGFHRRFFDIGELGGVRMEDAGVFETTHALVLALVREGLVDGLRIDHPDGLADPAGYLERLRRAGVEHVWVEKILEAGEELREWPVEGTVGYEFLNDVAALFVDPRGEAPMTALYEELTRERRSFAEVAFEAKLEVAVEIFEPELRELHQEIDVPNLPLALASFHVYRTYVEPWNDNVHDADREAIHAAALSDRLERTLLLDERGHDAFVTRFQQTTGPVMAKGVEDTAFYRYNRLVSLNEVGGDPARFGLTVGEFHARNLARAHRFPRHLLTTQTHDTKRSADVRARIGALSWIPDEWRAHVLRWREVNAPLRSQGAPDSNEEYLIYQTLVGAWPIEAERLEAYVEKAMREAKLNTSWIAPDERWESAVKSFCRGLLEHRPFLDNFEPFAAEVARRGEHASLGQLLLKLASPGVPDVYGGDELAFLALVDPDNRRPVDWALRRRLLDEVRSGAGPRPETRKLALIARALDLRRRRPEAFDGAYTPLEAGPRVCAFMRARGVLVVVPLVEGGDGGEVALPALAEGRWRDVVTGIEHELAGAVPVSALMEDFPVSLLERVSGDEGADAAALRRNTSGVGEGSWTPEGWEDRGPAAPERLPRVEDLPIAEHGYDRVAVQQAFEAFYRHAARLDATLRVLESMETFARQAGELRADIRALRAASWGPLPAARPAWRPSAEDRAYARRGSDLGGAVPRLAVEAAFIIVVAVAAAAADLPRVLIVALVLAAWVLVGISEFVASIRRAPLRPAVLRPPARATSSASASAPARAVEMPVSEPTMIEAPPAAEEAEEEAVAKAPPESEEQPGPVVEERRRRLFRRGHREPVAPAASPAQPSGHVRVVQSPPEPEPEREPEPPAVAEAAPGPEPVAPLQQTVTKSAEPEPVSNPQPEAESEPEQEPIPSLQQTVTRPPAPELEPEAAEEEVPEEPLEPAPAAEAEAEPEPEEPRERRWFGRRRAPEPGPRAEPPSHVELVEVEHAIAREQVSVAWEAEPEPVEQQSTAGDPWEHGPEPAGVELELVPDTEQPEAEPAHEPAAAEPERVERRPQPVRLRRGRR